MDRRQFIYTVAATSAGATKRRYDLIIKGGRVIDPGGKLNEINDVAIAGGHIAAIDPHIPADAPETIDARGKLVVPGLIDIHTHAARVSDGPALCLADGVTGLIERRIAGRGSHQRSDRNRQGGAATVPGSDQHRARRHPAGRRHNGHQPSRCGRRARGYWA
jgi:predicted amidohydrolase YtcJ